MKEPCFYFTCALFMSPYTTEHITVVFMRDSLMDKSAQHVNVKLYWCNWEKRKSSASRLFFFLFAYQPNTQPKMSLKMRVKFVKC